MKLIHAQAGGSVLATVLAIAGFMTQSVFAADAKKPNIVVIVADDLGYADVLFNPLHPKEVTTPNLDALAKESVICRQGYVSGHVCSPTRTGVMLGRYQQRLGLYTAGEAGSGVSMKETIFPQYLKPGGYVSMQVGKWHLGPTPEWSPALRGFDEVFGFLGRGAHDYFKLDDPNDPIYRGTTPVKVSGYLTDLWGQDACSFIERNKAKPFFLYLAFNAVHAPLQAPADEIAKFNTGNTDRNTLLAMGKRMDDAVGKVIATLKQQGIFDDTLLFFISDNGGPLANQSNNTPLRGGKHQDYEGGIRVPFLVCWPAQLKGIREFQSPVFSLDLVPTAMSAAGLELPKEKPLDGIDILPLLKGRIAPAPRTLYWSSGGAEGWWAIRSGDWKVVSEKAKTSLFDLSKDISEKNDLAAKMPEKVAELTKLHDQWLSQMPDPVSGGGKKWSREGPAKKKKTNKKKASGDPDGGAAAIVLPQRPAKLHETFATMPGKPWSESRGAWQAKDGGLWGSWKAGEEQDAILRVPVTFTHGTVQYDFNLNGATRHAIRFRTPEGENLFRVDITPAQASIHGMSGDYKGRADHAALKLQPNTWHTLTLKFGPGEFIVQVDDQRIRARHAMFSQKKSEVNFLVGGTSAGFRNFTLTADDEPEKAEAPAE